MSEQAPVHPSRGQAVWIERPGDGGSALVHCDLVSVADGKPSHVHSAPVSFLAMTGDEAEEYAAEHAAQHAQFDSVVAAPRTMPRNAHKAPTSGRTPSIDYTSVDALLSAGMTPASVARAMGISRSSVSRHRARKAEAVEGAKV